MRTGKGCTVRAGAGGDGLALFREWLYGEDCGDQGATEGGQGGRAGVGGVGDGLAPRMALAEDSGDQGVAGCEGRRARV